MSKESGSDATQQVQVSFDDQNPGETVQVPSNLEREGAQMGANVELSKFLKRPVLIYTYDWELGADTVVEIDPWHLYFNHTSIKKKVDNYAYMRCNLNLKVVINASPFHYGAMLLSYKPLKKFLNAAPISTALADEIANVGHSQNPRGFVYPQTSQGCSLRLPFLINTEWLNITAAANLEAMGTLRLAPLTPLQFANAGTGVDVSVQIYAYPDSVELSGPTVALALQGFIDEYGEGDGVVSKPASAVARFSGYLTKIPIIGPFATATQMLSSGVSGMAKLFGFTNVPVIEDVHAMIPAPFPALASTQVGIQLEKLTLDPKNELTIDPASIGVDLGDELMISNFTSRESYLYYFPWDISDVVDTAIFSVKVTPELLRTETVGSSVMLAMTPMCMVSRMFANWRGDITFRFKFIASQYHRGRVRISWDPVGAIGSTADSTTEVYTKIVDLAKCSDITINVPYMQAFAYLKTQEFASELLYQDGSATNIGGYTNGVLTVRVLTPLGAPVNTADVQVLVFVSGGDSLEFANPKRIPNNEHAYPVQSQIEDYDIQSDETEMGVVPTVAPEHINLLYFGETIKSLRQLMRRTTYYTTLRPNTAILTSTAADSHFHYFRIPRLPVLSGFISDGFHTATKPVAGGTGYFNFVEQTPLTYISQCFLGCRGSVDYRVNFSSPVHTNDLAVVRSDGRTAMTSTWVNYITEPTTSACARNRIMYWRTQPGLAMTNTKTNAGLAISAPFMSNLKFRDCSSSTANIGTSLDDSDVDWIQISFTAKPRMELEGNANTFYGTAIDLYTAAGTDYNPIFFANVPTIYSYTSPTAV
jgi:hypothetical protein